MAGRPKKTQNEEAKTTEKLQLDTQNEEIVENKIEVTPTVKKASEEPKKAEAKKLEDEDMVVVASYLSGRNQLTNNDKPFDSYVWLKFGATEEVRFGTLVQLRKKVGITVFTEALYILNEQAVKQLGLEKVYSELKPPKELKKVFELSLEDGLKFIENSSKELKLVLREILIDKLQNKENINFFNLRAYAEKLNIELDTIKFN